MTQSKIREKIRKKHTIGQEVNLRYRGQNGSILERKKATIINFYPNMIHCMVNGYNEGFTYWEFNYLTTY